MKLLLAVKLINMKQETANPMKVILLEVDGQWLTFPFPFVHHQPLHIYVLALVIEDRF